MSDLPQRWVTVDIGESTGYAVLSENRLLHAGTAEMWDFCVAAGAPLVVSSLSERIPDLELSESLDGWDLMVVEDWALDPSTAEKLAWDTQDTVRGLGALQFIALALGREFELQKRTIKKAARNAGAEDLFRRPLHDNRHANDAIMHAVHRAGMARKGLVEAG